MANSALRRHDDAARGWTQKMGRDLIPVYAFAGMLSARVFKPIPQVSALPVDLTLLLALVTAAYAVPRLGRLRFDRSIGLLLALLFALLVPSLWMASSEYAVTKAVQMFTLNTICLFAPLVLVNEPRKQRAFLNAVLVFAALAAVSVVGALAMGSSDVARLGSFDGQAIWSARLAGAGLVIISVSIVVGQTKPVWGIPMAALFGIAIFASGSRGPAIAAAVGVAASLIYLLRKRLIQPSRALVIPLAAIAIGAFVVQIAPQSSVDRIATLISAEALQTGVIRLDIGSAAASGILSHPAGIGWGSFDRLLIDRGYTMPEIAYPHNIFLEVGVEAGWAALGLLAAAVVMALRSLWKSHPFRSEAAALLGLMALYATAAQFSGDVNSNRFFFALVGIGIAARLNRSESSSLHYSQGDSPPAGSPVSLKPTPPAVSETN